AGLDPGLGRALLVELHRHGAVAHGSTAAGVIDRPVVHERTADGDPVAVVELACDGDRRPDRRSDEGQSDCQVGAAHTPTLSHQASPIGSILASWAGLSGASVGAASIESPASIPDTTVPKTVCLPSSQEASSTVTMKNCEPLVFGPALAIASAPRTTLWSLNSSSNV